MALDNAGVAYLTEFKNNLESGMRFCLEISNKEPYPGENLKSIPDFLAIQKAKLDLVFSKKIEIASEILAVS